MKLTVYVCVCFTGWLVMKLTVYVCVFHRLASDEADCDSQAGH